jgi:predicted kinase
VTLVVVTGVPGAGKSTLGSALAEAMGCPFVSLDAIKEELAADAAQTPLDWLRYAAEDEVVHRLDAFGGEAVLDVWIAPRRDRPRVTALLAPWWEGLVEVRCQVPADVAVERYVARERVWPHLPADEQTLQRIRDAVERPEALGAHRTLVVDTTRRVPVVALARTIRAETHVGARRPAP